VNVGLPGTGIGGIYYIGLAICMPIRELFRKKSRVVQKRTGGR
jgi:hypothetical protein